MTEQEKLDALYNLKYFETDKIGSFEVTRVPGGWIFKSTTRHEKHSNPVGGSESSVFVLYK